ncbi:MAG: sensor domain-containing diguanylate cyclase [Chitinispirillales bacterium]|jgi:diguanylate cyclase (GGDEF)-like protein/PAS domain S-box-containing protein|nr:sensor domain-containing diguanylate cyclase [Chitinispirillales bacterium]
MFFSKIPEFKKVARILKIDLSDRSALSAALISVFVGFNILSVCVLAACAAYFKPFEWPAFLPAVIVMVLWNGYFSVSICKQMVNDRAQNAKSQALSRRFQNTTKYFESILQDTSDIIISLDKDNYIFKFNNGAQEHFGYAQEDILGKPFEMLLFNPGDPQTAQLSADDEAKSVSAEIPMKTKTGQKIIVNMTMSKMKDGGFVITGQDITEKKILEEELQHKNELLNKLAITDTLTGLYNCRHFYHVVKGELSRLKRYPGRIISLVYIDVDKFKEYNDSEGHQMGDSVLKSLGEVINVCIRKDVDAGFRYGGDEFVIIMPDTTMDQAKVGAERIQKQFGAFKFGQTSLSIGIAEAQPDDDEKSFVRRADFAMYRSKKRGKNRITLSHENLNEVQESANT